MKLLKTAALTAIVIAAVVVLALEPAAGAGIESNLATCSKALGAGPRPRWVGEAAGPVAVAPGALEAMKRGPNGDLYAKVSLALKRSRAVTVSVPSALRGKVSLYYGRVLDREGKVTDSFADARGYDETEFRPCSGRAETVWRGGIRIKEPVASVYLLVQQGDEAEAVRLRLGRGRSS